MDTLTSGSLDAIHDYALGQEALSKNDRPSGSTLPEGDPRARNLGAADTCAAEKRSGPPGFTLGILPIGTAEGLLYLRRRSPLAKETVEIVTHVLPVRNCHSLSYNGNAS